MKIYAGINAGTNLSHFDEDEQRIVQTLAKDWFITNGGSRYKLKDNSSYTYCLIKPTHDYQVMFNLDREIIVVFSPYSNFEPRSLDTFEKIHSKYPDLRVENVCCILISKDNNIQNKIKNLLQGDPESRIIIPFSYDDFIFSTNTQFIKNRFRYFFFERDLFAFESPITKDFFFFGRTGIIQSLVSRHKSNENSGLFGLRKTGKTSVINGLSRALKLDDTPSVIIDCQDTSLNQRRWNYALHYILSEIKKQNNIQCQIEEESKYTPQDAGLKFERDIKRLFRKLNSKSILIIFDEIENSPNQYWKEEIDFVLFWQTIRSKFQKFGREEEVPIFSFLIVGTNPMCIEIPRIKDTDNPIFNKVPFEFIKGFDVTQTTEMIGKLGGYMGLEFDDDIFSKLKEDFGGHPYLMRHVSSIINEFAKKDRPTKIDKIQYQKAKDTFSHRYGHYLEMILEVLVKFYPEEYDMLNYLAIDDLETFKDLANLSPDLIAHLKGYNVIDENEGNYYFKIESIKHYLRNRNKYKALLKSPEERWKEISERRNKLEPKIRQLVRMNMQLIHGKSEAFKLVSDIYGEPRKSKIIGFDYNELFDSTKTEIYLIDMIKIIRKNYNDVFKNILGTNDSEIISSLETINKYRSDAHAKDISSDEMDFFRVHISRIEKIIDEFI